MCLSYVTSHRAMVSYYAPYFKGSMFWCIGSYVDIFFVLESTDLEAKVQNHEKLHIC